MAELFLDIGKSRIILAVLSDRDFPTVEVINFSEPLADVFRDEVSAEVVRAINKMRTISGEKIKNVWLSLGAADLVVKKMKQLKILSSKVKKEIKRSCLNQLRLSMISRALKEDIFYIVEEFRGLDVDGIFYPSLPSDQRLICHSLALESYVVGIERTKLSFLRQVLREAKAKLKSIVCRELMMAKVVFSNSEKLHGALFIDIGGKDIVILFYERMRLYAFKRLPFGGQDITSSIMKEFGVPFWVAEQLKRQYMDIDIVAKHRPVIRIEGVNKIYEIQGERLCEVVNRSIGKIFEAIKQEIHSWDVSFDKAVCSITGGVCLMDGVLEIAERILALPVRMAYCKNQSCVRVPPSYSSYSALVGAFWQWIDQGGYNRAWLEDLRIWLQEIWEFF